MSRRLDIAMFLVLPCLWGLSFPAISIGLEYLPPLLFAASRYDIAAIVLLGYAVLRIDDWWPTGRHNWTAIVGGGIFLVAGNGLLFVGQQTVPSGVASILQALVPIATALWAIGLLGERLSAVGAAGVGVGFLGIAMVVQPDPSNLAAGDTAGRLIIVLQVVSVSLGGVIVQRADPDIGRVPLAGWSMFLGAIILHVISLSVGEVLPPGAIVPTAVAAVLYLGVFATGIAFFLYYAILQDRGAFEASLVAYLVPIVATLVGVVYLDETIGILTFVGFGLVAVGFALLKRRAIAELVEPAVTVGGHG